MWRAAFLALLLISSWSALAAPAQEREWKRADGSKFKATLVRELDGEAVFRKDGQFLSVPLGDLAESDRKMILAATSGKTEAASDAPTEAAQPPDRSALAAPGGGEKVPWLVKPKTPIVNRDWTDDSSSRTYGKFIRIHERNVVILRGARTVNLPFDTLSDADQAYVNQILTERGEQPLTAPDQSSAQRPAALDVEPSGPVAPPDLPQPFGEPDNGPTPRGSQFFEELRQRQEERRLEQEEFSKQSGAIEPQPKTGGQEEPLPSTTYAQPPVADPDAPGHSEMLPGSRRTSDGGLRIDAKTVAEVRPVLIMGGVLLGLFAMLGVIIFIATTIASSNTPRHRRLY